MTGCRSFWALLMCLMTGWFASHVPAQSGFQMPESRLKKLNAKDLPGYRNLAEEIALVTDSPTARDLTIRLYLICAANSKGKLQRSALRGLIHSARNENERQKFKVLSFLTDPLFSNVFERPNRKNLSIDNEDKNLKSNETPKQKLLDALLSIREGKSLRAKKIMENVSVQNYFKKYQSILSLKEFNEACLMSELPNAVLLKILQLDLKIRGGDPELDSSQNENVTDAWRKLFKVKLPDRIPNLTFDTVTEFDPAKSTYQNGVWRKPPK